MGDFEPSAKIKKRNRGKGVSPKPDSMEPENIKFEAAESSEDEEEDT